MNDSSHYFAADSLPDVSVIIPVFNRAGLIVRALESAAVQRGGYQVEILVVDDASSDRLAEVVAGWREKWIQCEDRVKIVDCRVIRLPENAGPSVARNRGMDEAHGAYIAFLDSDDEWHEHALDARIRTLAANPDLDWVYCDFEFVRNAVLCEPSFTATRFAVRQVRWESREDGTRVPLNFFDCQLVQPLTQTSTLIIRRDRLKPEDRFDGTLRLAEDWEFTLRLSASTRVGYVDQVLVRRYVEPDGLTTHQGPWFAGNVRAGATVLARLTLTPAQRRFVEKRITEDLYEWGYHLNTVGQHREARAVLWRSLKRRIRWKTVKQMLKGLWGGVL